MNNYPDIWRGAQCSRTGCIDLRPALGVGRGDAGAPPKVLVCQKSGQNPENPVDNTAIKST